VQYGGVISPICHGTGKDQKTVSDNVVEIKLLSFDKDGKIADITIDENSEHMKCAKGSFGVFGMIYEIKFKVCSLTTVVVNDDRHLTGELFGKDTDSSKLKEVVEGNEAVEIFWFPFNGYTKEYNPYKHSQIWVKRFNKTDKKVTKEEKIKNDAKKLFWGNFRIFGANAIRFTTNHLTKDTVLTPMLLRHAFSILPKGESIQEYPEAIHYQQKIDDILVRDFEAVFKVDKDYKNIKEAFDIAIDFINKLGMENGKYICRVAVEVRFINGSDSVLLAQCYEDKLDKESRYAYLEVLDYVMGDDEEWNLFISQMLHKWMKVEGFIFPHWYFEFFYF
jgi:hypothetical protein